jgi:hypothetical protein
VIAHPFRGAKGRRSAPKRGPPAGFPPAEHDPARVGRCQSGIDPLRLLAALAGAVELVAREWMVMAGVGVV